MPGGEQTVSYADIHFPLPGGMVDQTVVSFVDKADAPTTSVTMTQERLAGGKAGLLRYVSAQLDEMKRGVPGYAVIKQGERSMGGASGLHVEATVQNASGKRVQHSLYVLDETRSRVVIATVTAHESASARARELVDGIASGLKLGGNA